jgi:hypothetical protein
MRSKSMEQKTKNSISGHSFKTCKLIDHDYGGVTVPQQKFLLSAHFILLDGAKEEARFEAGQQ